VKLGFDDITDIFRLYLNESSLISAHIIHLPFQRAQRIISEKGG